MSTPRPNSPPPPDDSALPLSDPQRNSDASAAWREVFESSAAGLRAFLISRLGQTSDVDDCLQVVYLRMIQCGDGVQPAARRAWLFRVAANESARLWRRRAATEKMLAGQPPPPTATAEDPAAQIIRQETTSRVAVALRQLPPQWRQIVQLRIHQDLTFQQIADRLQIPLGTALTQMRRALQRLRSELDSDEADPNES